MTLRDCTHPNPCKYPRKHCRDPQAPSSRDARRIHDEIQQQYNTSVACMPFCIIYCPRFLVFKSPTPLGSFAINTAIHSCSFRKYCVVSISARVAVSPVVLLFCCWLDMIGVPFKLSRSAKRSRMVISEFELF